MKIKINPDGTFPELNKGQIRELAIDFFSVCGYDCWINNNIAIKGRRFIGRKGVPDIIGFNKQTGEFFGCEVKANGDKLSKEQKDFLISLNKSAGVGYVVEDDGKGGIKYYLYLNEKS